MTSTEQQFLNDLDKKLWNAADRLRSSLDAAVYKHVVLGLIFLKYASDAFEDRRQELEQKFRDPQDEYYMDPADYGLIIEDDIGRELENRDYYREVNVFWVPLEARWNNLRDYSKLPIGTDLPWGKKTRGVALLLDDALAAVERENDKLKNVLGRDTFTRFEVPPTTLTGLIDLFSNTNFSAKEYNSQPLRLKSKDILGHVYEYFLGEFAQAEGKKGGQYYTPKSIVTLIVQMLRPFGGRVFDPAMGSGGFFVQSEEFGEEFGGKIGAISVYGQESNPTTWRLAAMNMVIRGIDFNFGEGPADSFLNDQHPDLRADFVMANPPFNMKEWGLDRLPENDPRWKYGTPPANNANFAWMQHMLYHLAPTGSMALLLANGSMSSNTGDEGEIRKSLIDADLVDCMVALPGQLFTNTPIPACIWFLTRNKDDRATTGGSRRYRKREILFIDASAMGTLVTRALRVLTDEDTCEIAKCYHVWQSALESQQFEREGFCRSVTTDEVRAHNYDLNPSRYVRQSSEIVGRDFSADLCLEQARNSRRSAEHYLARLECAIEAYGSAKLSDPGLQIKTIADLARPVRRVFNPRNYSNTSIVLYSIPAFDAYQKPENLAADQIKSNKWLINSECVLVSKLNPRIPRVWLVNKHSNQITVCSTEFAVLEPRLPEYKYLLYMHCLTREFARYMEANATGSTGSRQRVRSSDVLKAPIATPSKAVLLPFHQLSELLLNRASSLRAETEALSELAHFLFYNLHQSMGEGSIS